MYLLTISFSGASGARLFKTEISKLSLFRGMYNCTYVCVWLPVCAPICMRVHELMSRCTLRRRVLSL